ncbi:ATP-binding protein [Rhizobium pusense]|uniref:AAA family ATPase n=1 Tax=Agrobacterium pusense TaxID=648995 RepID=UPI0024485589|nr:AAA family ATPase [Agrobacterium pusense]MDH1271593.1 ATP-binding protein [Agrobacterium pusense]
MAISLSSLKSTKRADPPVILLYGVDGIGKTSLAAEFPDALYLPTEGERTPSDVELVTPGLEVSFNGSIASLNTQIIAVADANQALAGRVDEIEVEFGAATAGLSSDILAVANATSALATRTDTLTAALGGNNAQVNVKWQASAGPSGYAARYAIVAAVNDASFRSAALMLDVPSSTSSPTRIIMQAAQILMYGTDPSSLKRPFVFQDGVLYLDDVRVNTLAALSGVLGNVNIEDAYIGNLQVGTSNIAPGAVSVAVSASSGTLVVDHGAGSPNVLIIWKTRGTMSTTVNPPGLATASMTLSESGNIIDTQHSSSVQGGATAYVASSVNFIPPSGRTQTTFTIGGASGPSGSLQGGSLVSQITALVFKR